LKIFQELKEKYNAGIAHAFIFHGATSDYVHKRTFLKQALDRQFTEMTNEKNKKSVICYDRAEGISFHRPSDKEKFVAAVGDMLAVFNGEFPRDPSGAFMLIGEALTKGHFALIIDYAETVFPNGDIAAMSEPDRTALVSVLKWAKDNEDIRKYGNFIILITNSLSSIHPMLRTPSSRIECIGIRYPDPEERKTFIEETLDEYEKKKSPVKFEKDFSPEFMARATAGLTKVNIYDIVLRGRLKKNPLSLSLVRDRKNEIIKQEFQQVLDVSDPSFGFDLISGHTHIIDFFRKNIINAVRDGDYRRCPMGVLMSGPAGTGKSALAEALAYECGFNFAKLNLARTKEKWVGNSEANLEKVIWALKSFTPIIAFVDEIDTAASREGSGDSGVSQNIMKRLLEFMSDEKNRGKIIWLGATNRPENIDFALKRTGRFDKKIPVLPPSMEEVPDLFMVMFKKYGIAHSVTLEELTGISIGGAHWDISHGPVGSDIAEVVRKAYEIAADSGKSIVDISDVKAAAELIRPTVQDTSAMVASAIKECNDISLMPEAYRKAAKAQGVAYEERNL